MSFFYKTEHTETAGFGFESTWRLGGRFESTWKEYDFRTDYTKYGAHDQQITAEAGRSFEWMESRVSVEWFRATENYISAFSDSHIWLGIADLFGRRNITGWHVQGSVKPMRRITLFVDYHNFRRVSTSQTAFDATNTAYGTNSVAVLESLSKNLGYEVDFVMVYDASKNVDFEIGSSIFRHGSFFRNQALLNKDSSVKQFYTTLNVIF